MKAVKRFAEFIIVLIALGAALYLNRVAVADWWQEFQMPELPVSVSFEEVHEVGSGSLMGDEPGSLVGDPSTPSGQGPDSAQDDAGDEYASPDDADSEIDSPGDADPTADDVDTEEVSQDEVDSDEVIELPTSLNLAVPFTSQAPHADWNLPYKEACEEASVYMVERFYEGEPEGLIEAGKADEAIVTMATFVETMFGVGVVDTTVEQTGLFAEMMYGRTYEVLNEPTVDDMKEKLVQGHPVIVPAAGRLLGNPYFTAPGPIYHMLVIRGYTEDGQFIVNDPGTRHGEAYLYDFDTLMNAMHDWNNGEEITEGSRRALVIYP